MWLNIELAVLALSLMLIIFFNNLILNKILWWNKYFFYLQYISIVIHEFIHYITAIMCLKWPKYNWVHIVKNWNHLKIHWSVQIKIHKYSDLFYNIINWEKISSILFLIWEIITWFFVWLSPLIIPFWIFIFFILNINNDLMLYKIIYSHIWYIILSPIFLILSIIANLSKEDLTHASPWIILFLFIKLEDKYLEIIYFFVFLMLKILILIFFILIIKQIKYLSQKKAGKQTG